MLRPSKCELYWNLVSNSYSLIRAKNFPQWSGLKRFSSGAMATTFSDGSTFEDLSKVFSSAALHMR